MVPDHVLSAFNMMWDLFPEPVMLLHRNRAILATNSLARGMGVPLGIKCHQLNPEAGGDHCQACKANAALNSGKAVVETSEQAGRPIQGYWVPVQGHEDLYLHFGIGMREAAEAAAQVNA